VVNWNFFSSWVNSIQHGEVLGVKFDRKVSEAASSLIDNKGKLDGNPDFLRDVVSAVNVMYPALQGAKILWVDNNFGNNYYERHLVESMGIHVQVAWSEDEVIKYLDGTRDTPDLVISNVSNARVHRHLTLCPAMFSDFPIPEEKAKYAGNIWDYNRSIQDDPPFGLAIAELIASKRKEYSNRQQPRIIFYSASTADIMKGSCALATTNQYDVLLQAIVAAIGTFRSGQLVGFSLTRAGLTSPPSSEDKEK